MPLLPKVLSVAATAAAGKDRLARTVVGGAVIALCGAVAAAFLIAGLYQAFALARAPPWPALILAAGFGVAAVALKAALRAREHRAHRRRKQAQPDPLILMAAGFVLGLLSGPDRAERRD